jgi:hypothetical protein
MRLDKRSWVGYLRFAVLKHLQQLFVSSNDVLGRTGYGPVQELVIGWSAANRLRKRWGVDYFSSYREKIQNPGNVNTGEFLSQLCRYPPILIDDFDRQVAGICAHGMIEAARPSFPAAQGGCGDSGASRKSGR